MRRVIHYKGVKRVTFILISVSLIVAAYFIYLSVAPRQAYFHRVASTALLEEELGGVRLAQSIKSITPSPRPTHDNELYDYYTMDNGMTLATRLNDDKIIRIIAFSDSRMKTFKGIGVGHTTKDILAAYGSYYYNRGEQGARIIGYVDKRNHSSLEFWLQDDEVQMIRYDIDSMK